MSETPMNKLRALCEKFKCPNCRVEHMHDCFCYAHAAELRAILPDVERLVEALRRFIPLSGFCPKCGTSMEFKPTPSHEKNCDIGAAIAALEFMLDENCPRCGMPYTNHRGDRHAQGYVCPTALFGQPVAPKETK